MYLVFVTKKDIIGQTGEKTEVSRSYSSKLDIQSDFLKKHIEGETFVQAYQLPKESFKGAEVLGLNNHAGVQTRLEVLHMDSVKEV